MDRSKIKRDLEAVLFGSGRPLQLEELLSALSLSGQEAASLVTELLDELAREFPPSGPRGFELVRLAGGWAFRSNPSSQPAVQRLFDMPEEATRLSQAAMECLAIIAYLQPVSRSQIAAIRGVDSDSPLRTLLDRELITEVGRAQGGGGAILYGTTPRFEAMFGLSSLEDLPPLDGFALGPEQREELRRRLGILGVPE